MEKNEYKPKRLRTILVEAIDKAHLTKNEGTEEDPYLHEVIDELESNLKKHIKNTVITLEALGLVIDTQNFIGDLE